MKRARLLGPGLLALACIGPSPTEPAALFRAAASSDTARLLIAGDIASCTNTRDSETAALLDSLVGVYPAATVVPLGDLVYPTGTTASFTNCYHPTWGRHKSRSIPAVGNHEYDASATAEFYFDYWNGVGAASGRAGIRGKGYHSWSPHPAWHVVTLNTNSAFVPTKAGSVQDTWLVANLAATSAPCVLGLFHHPRYASPVNTTSTTLPALPGYTLSPWRRLEAKRADLIVSASQHYYERYTRQRGDSADTSGVRQIIVGTGGASGSPTPPVYRTNSEVWATALGVLMLELGDGWYSWRFVSVSGRTFTDSGRNDCHGAGAVPDTTPPPPPPPPPPAITLAVTGRSDATKDYMTLDWTGAVGDSVEVYRNGAFLTPQFNDGHYTNSRTAQVAPVTYTYQVCERGHAVCSAEASVTFP